MCGIAGEYRFDDSRAELACMDRMLDELARRGPDHAGSYSAGPLAMGHRRLAIVDLSSRANQPMVDARCGLVLVFNGAIYNHDMLRAELRAAGHRFSSCGDSEVILKAYAQWGPDCVPRLLGMFAFAIWDMRAGVLFLARDRLGIKPLYYSHSRRALRFASNTRALLAAGDVDRGIDPVALHHHLTLHGVVPAPRTLLRGIRKLEPGTTLTVDSSGNYRVGRYWELQVPADRPSADAEEWRQRVQEQLLLAVGRRSSVADVPVGVLLSGGLDSSLLVALLAASGTDPIKTFSVGFEDQPEERGSEFEYSDLVVERFGTDHRQYLIPDRQLLERLPEAVTCMAEPMVGQDAVAFYLLAEQVSNDVKVVQSGQGADEVFAGYFWYPRMMAARGSDLQRFAPLYFDRNHQDYLAAVDPVFHGPDYTSEKVSALLARPGADRFIDRVLRLDVGTLIVDDPVKRVDNMTMAWGLEARVPFLDHELVELAMGMPPELKLAGGGKGVLKDMARGLLPEVIIQRTKAYFPVPALRYVRGEFLDFMTGVLRSDRCRQRGLFRHGYLERLLAEPETQVTPLRGSLLWHAALLELWLQLNVD
jgi:asparagine synthase (glutamine-hydrolysing)